MKKRNDFQLYTLEDIEDLNLLVVTQLGVTHDGKFSFPDISEDIGLVQHTPFEAERVYKIHNDDVDIYLALSLCLGMLQDYDNGDYYLYHLSPKAKSAEKMEMLRLGMYYQIKHPEYCDIKLSALYSIGGRAYFEHLLLIKDLNTLQRLEDAFDSQKGKPNNVIKFNKRV